MPAREHPLGAVGQSASLRLWMMAGILGLECVPATVGSHPWFQVRTLASAAIFFCVSLLFFGRDKLKAASWSAAALDKTWAELHVSCLAMFCVTNYLLAESVRAGLALGRGMLSLWYVALILLPITLGAALFDPRRLLHLLRSLGSAWGLAAISGVLVMSARSLMMMAWDAPGSRFGEAMRVATFGGVRALLGLFYANVEADPATSVIGTPKFMVEISGLCSGIEGLALMLTLTLGWLFYSRRELRLGRALLLVPVSLAMTWMFNLVRIAGLIAIGDSGHPTIASGGFHSHAGWIFFSCVALAFLLTVNGVVWFRKAETGAGVLVSPVGRAGGDLLSGTNLAAVYLMPFLAIVAAGLLAASASADGFERWYGLRLVAAVAVLYAYRREYRRMDWRFDWLGPVAGLAVFVIWIALDRWIGGAAAGGVAASVVAQGLAQLSGGQRLVWIAVRTIAAGLTVPIAEELAFRGYIARRLMSPDVESVPLRSLSVFAVLGSSVAFGALHGRMWLAGMLAGVVFAVVAKMRNRLGDAIAAHATANLAIAAWVLMRADYSLW